MPAAPEHVRAPEVARAALKEATDLFGRLLAAAIRDGAENGVTSLALAASYAARRAWPLARTESESAVRRDDTSVMNDGRCVWREKWPEAKDALERDAAPAQPDPLAPQPRPRPPVGEFTIVDLGPDTCRFPFGDGPFLFCGATPMPGKPYCAGCIRGLYRSPDPDDEEALPAS
jgi:hypothetical protein